MKFIPLLLGVVVLLAGCAAEAVPSPEPTAPTTNPALPSWTPDVIVQREFDGVTCEIRMRVVAASDTPTAETALLVTSAKAFLAAGDWSDVEVSIADYPDDQLAAKREQGLPDATLLIMLVQDHVTADLTASALTGPGLTTEGFTACDPAA